MVADFSKGIHDVARGARYLLSRPRLWRWILAPALLTGVLVVLAAFAVAGWGADLLDGLVAWIPGAWAEVVVRIFLWIAIVIAGAFVFVSLAALIAAPFNEMLSEEIEEQVTGRPSPPFHLGGFLLDLVIGIGHAARRVAVYLVTTAALFVLSVVVPVVGAMIALAGGAVVTARFTSYDAYDAVWARRRWSYADKIAYLRSHRSRTMGLGTGVTALMLMPGLGLAALSIGAAAATLAFLEEETSGARRSAITSG